LLFLVEMTMDVWSKTIYTISVYCVMKCRGVLHTPLPHPRGFSSFCSITQHADVVLRYRWMLCAGMVCESFLGWAGVFSVRGRYR
jgi:hypothetical protein